jgi:hypothetical protein
VLNISPAAAYTSFADKRPLITRFSNQLSVRLDKKTQGESLLSSLNPFNQNINDTQLVSTNSSFRNTFFFNRTSTVFGSDVTYQQNQSKSLLTNGFESRTLTTQEANARWNITRSFLINISYIKGDKQNSSEFFSSRNYHLKSDETEPKLSFQPSVSFRTTVSYKYSLKKNVEGDIGEKALSNKFGLEFKYSTVKAGTISARVNYIEINFNGEQNSSLAYEMLEGLRNGKNITWNASVQRNLGNSMQLNLNYDGRKSEGNDIIHTGGVQFRAFF